MEMSKIDFSITINMSLVLQSNKANISIKDVELKPAVITLPIQLSEGERQIYTKKKDKKTIHDIVVETAQRIVAEKDQAIFSASDLFHLAEGRYPYLNRNSFSAHVISAAPEHPSWKHYPNRKKLLTFLGKGKYKLREE